MATIIEENEIETLTLTGKYHDPVNKSRHYIDDDELTKILTEWSLASKQSVLEGQARLPLPDYVAIAIMDMADAMGKRHNFANYSYIDDMKSEAILHCVKYIHNFNPTKKSDKKGKVSAFGYINMIIWRCFTHMIVEEKQEQYFKYKSFEIMGGMDAFQDDDMKEASGGNMSTDEGGSPNIGILGGDFMDKIAEYESKYGNGQTVRKERKGVEFDSFMFNLEEDEMERQDTLRDELDEVN